MARYFRPRTLAEALDVRAQGPVTILAGGTDVYPARTGRAGWGDMRQFDVLDISAVDELRGITETAEGFRFGSLTTWTDLRRASLPATFAGYQAAAREVGGLQVQNRGTLVGNICTASPAGDGIPCLLTLDTEIELASLGGRRTVSLSAFITGYRRTDCRTDEIVTAIQVPRPAPGARGGFRKLGARRYLVISIVMAAGTIAIDDTGAVTEARLAVGACGPVATRLPALEAALVAQNLADAPHIVSADHLTELAPLDDIRGSGEYRGAAALDLVRDLVAGFSSDRQERAA